MMAETAATGRQRHTKSIEERRKELETELEHFRQENEEVFIAAQLMRHSQEVKLVRINKVLRNRGGALY